MKTHPLPQTATPATLQTVLDRLVGTGGLSPSRKRDLRSAVTSFAKLQGQPPAAVPLDLADIRQALDRMVPARAQISAKRWANLRSDLAAAIDAAGMQPMLRTAGIELDHAWRRLLADADQWIRLALSRFARWASLRRVAPEAVEDSTIERFIAELHASTLVRNLRYRSDLVRRAWNARLAAPHRVAAGCHKGHRAYPETNILAPSPCVLSTRCDAVLGLGGGAGSP
jgi:hypothetical protein